MGRISTMAITLVALGPLALACDAAELTAATASTSLSTGLRSIDGAGRTPATPEATAAPVAGIADRELEYLNRPDYVWVAQFDDYVQHGQEDYFIKPAGGGSVSGQWTTLHLTAFNGSGVEVKVRVKAIDDNGGQWIERDVALPSLNRRPLVDPTFPQINNGTWIDGTRFPSVFVVASDVPLMLDGYVYVHSNAYDLDLETQSKSASKRSIRFHAVDCGQAGTEAVCALPVQTTPWTGWAE
jgi:hypothetical protein